MEDRILITLDKLDIGGVETYVINQVKTLRKLGKKVFVMAKDGSYTEKIKEYGAVFIEYNFRERIYFDNKEIEDVIKIIKRNKITQVHINQFTAITSMMPACILTNTPYVAYLHMGVSFIKDKEKNPFDYLEKQYITYKKLLSIFFKNASKIIAITDAVRDYTAERYNIEKKKFLVCPNSIDLDEFSSKKDVLEINKIFIIGRLSEEKETSIINGIKLYSQLKKKNNKATLTIAGDGNIRKKIESYVDENEIKDVKFLGAISNVVEVLEEQDLLIGQGRCILEAISMKKLAVITGYENMKGMINKDSFKNCIKDNFTGNTLNDKTVEEVATSLLKLKENDIKKVINSNYKILQQKFDIKKNIFYLNKKEVTTYNQLLLIKDIMELNEILGKSKIEYESKADEIWRLYKDYEKQMKKYSLFEASIRIIKAPTRVIRNILKR